MRQRKTLYGQDLHRRKLVARRNNSASAEEEIIGALSMASSMVENAAASLVISNIEESLACCDFDESSWRDVWVPSKWPKSSSSSRYRLTALRDVDWAMAMKSILEGDRLCLRACGWRCYAVIVMRFQIPFG